MGAIMIAIPKPTLAWHDAKSKSGGSSNSANAQQVAKPESVGSDSLSYLRPLGLIEYLNSRMLGLETRQTHVHMD